MQDLVFYDFGFNRLWNSGRYISVNWSINYCGCGSFEAHLPKTQGDIVSILDQNPYLLCVQGEYQAIITGWRLDEDIAIFGKTPEWLMTKRASQISSYTNQRPAAIANSIVSAAMGDFVTVLSPVFAGDNADYSISRVKTVHSAVCEVLSRDKLGFKLRVDIKKKRFEFSTYKGAEQASVLSRSSKSAHSITYTKELQDFASGIWYQQKAESADEGSSASQAQWVYYSDNSALKGAKKWECILEGISTDDEAQADLRSKKAAETLDAQIRRLKYGIDYNLGDTVRVQLSFGEFKKTLTKRVSTIQIFYDVDRQGICPILTD